MTKHRGNFASVESIAARLSAERLLTPRTGSPIEKPPTPEERRAVAMRRSAVLDDDPPIDPERVRSDLRASRLTPRALEVPCSAHCASVGEHCWGRPGIAAGICRGRVSLGIRRAAS